MNLGAQSAFLALVSITIYLIAPVPLLLRGWLIRAGFAMLLAALLPIGWESVFTDSDAPRFEILMVLMLPIPLLLISSGIVSFFPPLISRRGEPRARAAL